MHPLPRLGCGLIGAKAKLLYPGTHGHHLPSWGRHEAASLGLVVGVHPRNHGVHPWSRHPLHPSEPLLAGEFAEFVDARTLHDHHIRDDPPVQQQRDDLARDPFVPRCDDRRDDRTQAGAREEVVIGDGGIGEQGIDDLPHLMRILSALRASDAVAQADRVFDDVVDLPLVALLGGLEVGPDPQANLLAALGRIVADDPTLCHHLSSEAFEELSRDDPEVALALHRAIALSLSGRLRRITTQLSALEGA